MRSEPVTTDDRAAVDEWIPVRMDKYLQHIKRQLSPEMLADRDVMHYSIPAVQEVGTGIIEDGSTIDSSKLIVDRDLLLVSRLNPRKSTICLAEPASKLTVCSTEFVPIAARGIDQRFLFYRLFASKCGVRSVARRR